MAAASGMCRLPSELKWSHLVGAGIFGGIGFTISIFITNLAFPASPETINASKMTILLASLAAGVFGFVWLRFFGKYGERTGGERRIQTRFSGVGDRGDIPALRAWHRCRTEL
ncbi:hypothetical protein ACCAA_20078 [Candidatus Accumulibacter aalborgensis]|uniref:Na+/H+ antiporter NhaA n=1 Tax=Candidatus Accumulibacter aalborgensis TaxID=1860102 RepID=A0A1A8XJW8_9PROT|nr:hypothetical protein ACCAA_20078 [Candidatus Accumulibacter aalborgensis]